MNLLKYFERKKKIQKIFQNGKIKIKNEYKPDKTEKSVVDGHQKIEIDPRQEFRLNRDIARDSNTVGGECEQRSHTCYLFRNLRLIID